VSTLDGGPPPILADPFIVLPDDLASLCPVPGCVSGGLAASFAWVGDPSVFVAGAPPLAGPAGETPAGAATGYVTLTLADAADPSFTLSTVPGGGRILLAFPAIPAGVATPAQPAFDPTLAHACVRADAGSPSGWTFETYVGIDAGTGGALCSVAGTGTVLIIQYAPASPVDGPWYGYGPNPTVIARVGFPALDGDPALFDIPGFIAALKSRLPPGSVVRVIVVVPADELGSGVIVQFEAEAPLSTAGLIAAIDLEAALAAGGPADLAPWFDPAVYGPAQRLTWTVSRWSCERGEEGGGGWMGGMAQR
jgi:hypothetical protein